MKPASYLTLPILWLFLGPPILRDPAGRSAMESLGGQFDVWNVVRLGWWLVLGAVALASVYRHRAHVRAFVATMPQLAVWAGVWVSSLVVSSLYSPASSFTLANAGMMSVLVAASFELGLRLYARSIDLRSVLAGVYVFSISLLALITAFYLVDPYRVSVVKRFGLRILGGFIADVPLLAVAAIFLALHAAADASRGARFWHAFVMVASVVLLLLTQSRTAFIAVAVVAPYLFVQWFLGATRRARVLAVGTLFVLAGLAPVAVTIVDEQMGESSLTQLIEFVRRDEVTFRTGSGRTAISALVLERVNEQPWGLGYSAGPRLLLQTSTSELAEQSVHAQGIGNAHNMYLEVLGGSGVVGLFAFLAVLVWVLFNAHRIALRDLQPVRVLFVFCLLAGLTGSGGALPFFQASALIWVLIGGVAGVNALDVARTRSSDADRRRT
jgi:O-antigen ligase